MNETLTAPIHARIVGAMTTHAKERSVGDRLDELMKGNPQFRARGQSALARASGVPQPTINRILNNRSDPESENVRKLASVFGVTFEWLMSERGPKYVVDLSYTDQKGNRVLAEAKYLPLSADSAKTEEVVNTSNEGPNAGVNHDLREIAQQFVAELMDAVQEGRVSEEMVRLLSGMLHAGTATRARGDQERKEKIAVAKHGRRSTKRGTGT